jgi:hypothetical protein
LELELHKNADASRHGALLAEGVGQAVTEPIARDDAFDFNRD